MILVNSIKLAFGDQKVFNNISLIINSEERIGLVGRNGSGKTTFLKALLDPKTLNSGSVTIQKNYEVAYLPQEVVLDSERNIFDETFSTFENIALLLEKASLLEQKMHDAENHDAIEEYAEIQEKIRFENIEEKKAEVKKILAGLGFLDAQLNQPVTTLSVGWKMRIVLAKLLLKKADFYLFDEPTNHLDLLAKEWFLGFLKSANFGFILICHEKYFLDELCHKILELERGNATVYEGNYSKYIFEKEKKLEDLTKAQALQDKEIKQKQATIDRFKASASRSKMAKSMAKQLEKIERIELPPSAKNITFRIPPTTPSGKVVLTVENIAQQFEEKMIFKNASFEILAGKKVAIVAPNGGGKTTLFNVITKALPLQSGSINFGYNVKYAIFAQDQNKALNRQKSILENVLQLCPTTDEAQARGMLGAFLFSGDDVKKKVSVLSGGEKNRVGMVVVLLQKANFLLLDEPTNHLDIPSKEILLKALQEFTGTILFVSHDKDFVNDLATDILELSPLGTHLYQGNFDEYVYQKNSLEQKPKLEQIADQKQKTKKALNEKKETSKPQNTQKELALIEQKIFKTEKSITELTEAFNFLQFGTKEFEKNVALLDEAKKALLLLEKQWEELMKE